MRRDLQPGHVGHDGGQQAALDAGGKFEVMLQAALLRVAVVVETDAGGEV